MTQLEKIIRHLNDYGTITPIEALMEYSIMRLSARIWDLRHKKGYEIETKMIYGVNRYGEPTKWAKYRLM